jgi:hypothetical protein
MELLNSMLQVVNFPETLPGATQNPTSQNHIELNHQSVLYSSPFITAIAQPLSCSSRCFKLAWRLLRGRGELRRIQICSPFPEPWIAQILHCPLCLTQNHPQKGWIKLKFHLHLAHQFHPDLSHFGHIWKTLDIIDRYFIKVIGII